MKRKLLLTVALTILSSPAFPCAEPDTLFYYPDKPDARESFLHGDLGILLPSYRTDYLAAAYRFISGKPLDQQESSALDTYIKGREEIYYGYRSSGIPGVWLEARKAAGVADDPGISSPYAESANYTSYLNCNTNAFNKAAELLKTRVRGYGPASRQVKEWVAAQDAVFANCSHPRQSESGEKTEKEISLPEPAKPGDNGAVKRDRAYQTAAAYFYAENYGEARERFKKIAADKRSEFSKLASYLVVRTYVRDAFATEVAGAANDYFRQAESTALGILADPSLSDIHRMTSQLLSLVRFRIAPEKERTRLGTYLAGKWDTEEDLKTAMTDYSRLISQRWLTAENADEMTDWILSFEDSERYMAGHSLEKWKNGGGEIWLLAALARITATYEYPAELMDAAQAVPASSPIYTSIAYQRMRILDEHGRGREAGGLAASLLGSKNIILSNGSRNLVKEYATRSANNLNEYLAMDARTPVEPSYRPDTTLGYPAIHVLDTLVPVSGFNAIIAYKPTDDVVRRELFLAAWVRALAIGEKAEALKLARTFRKQGIESVLNPALDAYLAEKSEEGRAFMAAFIILKNQSLNAQVGNFRTAEDYKQLKKRAEPLWTQLYISTTDSYDSKEDAELISFLKPEDMARARKEVVSLLEAGHPVAWLAGTVFSYAERHPDDPDVPEALFEISNYQDGFEHSDAAVEAETTKSRQLLETKYMSEFAALIKARSNGD